jgi:hypothetical protein
MRENRLSGLMRGGEQTVIGLGLSIRRSLPTLHVSEIYVSGKESKAVDADALATWFAVKHPGCKLTVEEFR